METRDRRRGERSRAIPGVALWCAAHLAAASALGTAGAAATTPPASAGGGGTRTLLFAALGELAPDQGTRPSCDRRVRPLGGLVEGPGFPRGRFELAQSSSLCCKDGVLYQKTTSGGRTTLTRLGGACPAGTPPC